VFGYRAEVAAVEVGTGRNTAFEGLATGSSRS
jgi:hypothetical protein